MSSESGALVLVGAVIFSLCMYGLVLIQLRRGVPERFRQYSVELTLLAVGGLGLAVARGSDPRWVAASPGLAYGLCLLAGKGSVLTLLSDARFGDVRSPEVKRAQKRLVVLMLGATAIAVAAAVARA